MGENIFEEYLRNLFSIGEKKRVGKERRMYVHFKNKNKRLTTESAKETLKNILKYTLVYNQIREPIIYPHPCHKIKNLLIKISNTNMASISPFLMALLKSLWNETISEEDTVKLLHESYVLLVRRKITKLPVTKYDVFFPSLMNKIVNEPDKVKAFQNQVQSEQLWVSDHEFENAFVTKEVYNQRELNFSRLVLQEIDSAMQKYDELPDYTSIHTIEHILPQTLNADWTQYLGNDATNINLPVIINTLGNLSLNSGPANSTFGQKPFEEKKQLYNLLCALARDIKEREVTWNIEAIQNRSRDLAKTVLKVWSWNL